MWQTILAIDYGQNRVGFAIGYPEKQMTFPLTGCRRKSNRDLVAQIKALIVEYGVEGILVGYPRHRDGTVSLTCSKVDFFIRRLERALGITVEKVDEYLTSWEAEQRLGALERSPRQRRELADSFAAESMIKTWLNEKQKNKSSGSASSFS